MNKHELSRLEQMSRSNDSETLYLASLILRKQPERRASTILRSIPINQRVKDYSDICEELRIKEFGLDDFLMFPEYQRTKLLAAHQIMNIAEVINEGWAPDWNNSNEKKWYPWFTRKNSLWVFTGSYCRDDDSAGQVGFYQSKEKSDMAVTLFLPIYQKWLG